MCNKKNSYHLKETLNKVKKRRSINLNIKKQLKKKPYKKALIFLKKNQKKKIIQNKNLKVKYY